MASSDEKQGRNPFGDVSLFQQFDDENNQEKIIDRFRSQESNKDKLLADLRKENEELRQRLRLLEPPSEGRFESATDSPIIQVIFMQHDSISKKRQFVEDFLQNVVTSHDEEADNVSTYDQLLPQRSSLRIKGTNVTFLATGSVQYYDKFCLDILGRPLVDGDISMTENWDIPDFTRGFPDPLPLDLDGPRGKKPKRPKATCFNCGEEGHSLRDCPAEKDYARINEMKNKFMSNSSPGLNSKRYHKDADSDQKFAEFKPGVVSDELRTALGLGPQDLPHYIYTMRMLGYPPGYLLEAEITSSGLAVYDKLIDEDGEIKDVHEKSMKYNLDRLFKYPGFNVPLPEGVIDNCQYRNMLPMQEYHQYDLFHSVMASQQPSSNDRPKRKGEFSESEEKHKRKRSRVQEVKDMDITSTPSSSELDGRGFGLDDDGNQGSPFRPPLPPSPATSDLPPLPMSTPPETPNRTPTHTPRDTPLSSLENTPIPSPSVCSSDGICPEGDLLSPSLEDLVNQQKELMTQLDVAATITSSDSEVAPSAGREIILRSLGATQNGNSKETGAKESVVFEFVVTDEVSEDSQGIDTIPGGEKADNGDLPDNDENHQNPTDVSTEDHGLPAKQWFPSETGEEDELPNKSGVPHRTNFAEGITPHVDVNVSASKGVFKKILGLLKTSKDKIL